MNSVRKAAAALRSGLWPPKLSLGTSIEQVLARRTARRASRATLFLAQNLQHLQPLQVSGLGHNAAVISPGFSAVLLHGSQGLAMAQICTAAETVIT